MITLDQTVRELAKIDPRLAIAALARNQCSRLDAERAAFRLSFRAGLNKDEALRAGAEAFFSSELTYHVEQLPKAPLAPLPHHNDDEAP